MPRYRSDDTYSGPIPFYYTVVNLEGRDGGCRSWTRRRIHFEYPGDPEIPEAAPIPQDSLGRYHVSRGRPGLDRERDRWRGRGSCHSVLGISPACSVLGDCPACPVLGDYPACVFRRCRRRSGRARGSRHHEGCRSGGNYGRRYRNNLPRKNAHTSPSIGRLLALYVYPSMRTTIAGSGIFFVMTSLALLYPIPSRAQISPLAGLWPGDFRRAALFSFPRGMHGRRL
jgi:hypothetical protein